MTSQKGSRFQNFKILTSPSVVSPQKTYPYQIWGQNDHFIMFLSCDCYKGACIVVTAVLVTWHTLRLHSVWTNDFQTMFLIWIFIRIKFPLQRYHIRPHLDNLIFFHHYGIIPEMTSLPGSCPHFEQGHGGSFFLFIYQDH